LSREVHGIRSLRENQEAKIHQSCLDQSALQIDEEADVRSLGGDVK
jgi:hypothetical protein